MFLTIELCLEEFVRFLYTKGKIQQHTTIMR